MEEGYGGPVWHASAAPTRWPLSEGLLRALAQLALEGVGDALLGEWHEWSGRAYHLRRRLTEAEAELIGAVVDVRGTPEGAKRLARIERFMPPGNEHLIDAERRRPA